MSYSIYVIHQIKKVGLAKNVEDRVERQQGWEKGEYEIFAEVKDLATARMIEKTVAEELNYNKDEHGEDMVDKFLKRKGLKQTDNCCEFYTKAIKDVTVGFPTELSDFDSWVEGRKVTLDSPQYGKLVFDTDEKRKWLTDNVKASRYSNPDRATYVYLKAAAKYLNNLTDETTCDRPVCDGRVDRLLADIHSWADNRGILKGKIETQTLKLGEEFGELQKAVLKSDSHEIKDAIGDIIVVLVSIAHFNGHSVADSLQLAYDTISKRTGYTNEKGDFIKTHYNGEEIKNTL